MSGTNSVNGNAVGRDKGEIVSFSRHLKKWLLVAAGTILVGLGAAGIFLPLLPTTPFLLLAAVCYAGSSPRFYRWLLNNRWFGSYIRDYREGKGLTRTTKIVTLASLWATIGYSAVFVVPWPPGQLALFAIAAGVTIHVIGRPTSTS
jgi:uncharacterized protein